MTNEKLRALLAEAREEIDAWGVGPRSPLVQRIDAALAETPTPVEVLLKRLGELADGCDRFREERDEARAEVARLRWGNEMACENTPTKGCECPGCGLARERAERGEDGP